MSNCDIKLFDRVKQKTTHAAGTGSINLTTDVTGFKSFGDVYSDQDVLFYCINDGTNFEIGSGVYNTGSPPSLSRNAFYSSKSDNTAVSFSAGTKEVFVTYPATHSVSIGSGIGNINLPQQSGIAFWNCNNIIDYDNNFIWDKDSKYLGIRNQAPVYAIDIGGDGSAQSMVRASGYFVGPTGLHFPANNGDDSEYAGGIQYQHALKNQLLNAETENVFGLSGVVNETIYLNRQPKGTFLAGPSSGCSPPCSPDFPVFRPITLDDFPQVEGVSGYLDDKYFNASGYLHADMISRDSAVSGHLQTQITARVIGSGTPNQVPRFVLPFARDAGNVLDYTQIVTSGIIHDNGVVVGILNENPQAQLDVSGTILSRNTVAQSGDFGVLNFPMTAASDYPNEFLSDQEPNVYHSGLLFYDAVRNDLTLYNDVSGVMPRLSQDRVIKVKNENDYDIPKGYVVRVVGSDNSKHLRVDLAVASGNTESQNVLGVASSNIFASGDHGYVTVRGIVEGAPLALVSAGQPAFLHETSSGAYNSTAPNFPSYKQRIGYCVKSGGTGTLYVDIGERTNLTGANVTTSGTLINSGILFVKHKSITGDIAAGNAANLVIGTDDQYLPPVRLGVGTNEPTEALDINSSGIRIRTTATPTAISPGRVGEIQWDANYIYVCTAANTWKRAALTGGF